MRASKIHIICYGNALCSDDGVGHLVFELLQSELQARPQWADTVQLFYAGNSGPRAIPFFMDCDRVFVVDAVMVSDQAVPGRIHCLSDAELSIIEQGPGTSCSTHLLAFPQCWRLLQLLEHEPPELSLFAIEIAQAALGTEGLSLPVIQGAHRVAQQVVLRCESLIQQASEQQPG